MFTTVNQRVLGSSPEYFANNSTLNKLFSFNWTDEDNNAINQLTDFTDTFLNREHLHSSTPLN